MKGFSALLCAALAPLPASCLGAQSTGPMNDPTGSGGIANRHFEVPVNQPASRDESGWSRVADYAAASAVERVVRAWWSAARNGSVKQSSSRGRHYAATLHTAVPDTPTTRRSSVILALTQFQRGPTQPSSKAATTLPPLPEGLPPRHPWRRSLARAQPSVAISRQ